MSTDGYGHGIDELLERHCGSYDSADFVRLAMAAATEAGLSGGQLGLLRLWIEAPPSHTAILSAEAAARGLAAADPWTGEQDDMVLYMVPAGTNMPRLCMAALDQAGMSVAGQKAVESLLGVPA